MLIDVLTSFCNKSRSPRNECERFEPQTSIRNFHRFSSRRSSFQRETRRYCANTENTKVERRNRLYERVDKLHLVLNTHTQHTRTQRNSFIRVLLEAYKRKRKVETFRGDLDCRLVMNSTFFSLTFLLWASSGRTSCAWAIPQDRLLTWVEELRCTVLYFTIDAIAVRAELFLQKDTRYRTRDNVACFHLNVSFLNVVSLQETVTNRGPIDRDARVVRGVP